MSKLDPKQGQIAPQRVPQGIYIPRGVCTSVATCGSKAVWVSQCGSSGRGPPPAGRYTALVRLTNSLARPPYELSPTLSVQPSPPDAIPPIHWLGSTSKTLPVWPSARLAAVFKQSFREIPHVNRRQNRACERTDCGRDAPWRGAVHDDHGRVVIYRRLPAPRGEKEEAQGHKASHLSPPAGSKAGQEPGLAESFLVSVRKGL